MMFGSKVNIFVSICPGYDYVPTNEGRRMTLEHIYMLTIESPKYNFPSTVKRDPNPTHFSIVWNDKVQSYDVRQVRPTNFGVAGSILIQKAAHTSIPKLVHQLETNLHNDPLSELEEDEDVSSEQWMRSALLALQSDGTVKDFDVDLFMDFAHAYLEGRLDGQGPARISYSRMHGDQDAKAKKPGFWISYYNSVPRESDRGDPYGGLM